MKKILSFTIDAVLIILTLDFLGFVMWAMSGQMPADGFYIGAITHHLLTFFF